MSQELDERLKRMREELDALQQIKTQEDFDEGARLHAAKNAPWVKGQYSHLEFPPYRYQEFPRMLYGLDYPSAIRERAEAEMMPAIGINDTDRKKAIILADRRIQAATCIVQNEKELRAKGAGWFESPAGPEAELARQQTAIETAAAHRAYEDRNMSEAAKREIDAHDDASEEFVPEIPVSKRGPRMKRVAGGA